MGVKLNMLAVNQIQKGTVIYSENESVNSICLIVKGRVLISNRGSKFLAGSGSFIGIPDLYIGSFNSTYIAVEDVVLYAFSIHNSEELNQLLSSNVDYRGLMVAGLNRCILEYDKVHSALGRIVDTLYSTIHNSYNRYIEIAEQSGHNYTTISKIEEINPYDGDITVEQNRINYYKESVHIPIEVMKSFYSHSAQVTSYQIEEQAYIISEILSECGEKVIYTTELFDLLINSTEFCLFKGVAKLAMDVKDQGGDNKELVLMVEDIKNLIHKTAKVIIDNIGRKIDYQSDIVDEIYKKLVTGMKQSNLDSKMQMKYSDKDTNIAFSELKNSLQQILQYGNLGEEKTTTFEQLITDFKNLKDKFSTEDRIRLLRKRISDLFYELYEKVFIRAYEEKNENRVIDMFLSYGYIDENLLSKESVLELYYLTDEEALSGPCKVYNIKEWLTAIYEGKKEPSKNEFDLDYIENLRELKKTTKLTPTQEREYLEDPNKRLNFEINNMFRYNNRLVNGQVTTFVPILYNDAIINDLSKVVLTSRKVNDVILELLKIDYSVFHREVLYYDESIGIKKEYVMQPVYPDIILLPTYGQKSVMWQEITGKRRNTAGRFLFPMFAELNLEDQLIQLFGRFRWELCRCIQGTAWNDIKYKSLTSEYSDYIQFYRKNRELSEDRKEKIKAQIQKGRHNTREIFVIDYELWIKGEAKGAIRLNKIVREMLATYCPFSLEIRNRIANQPLFDEAMARFNRNRLKKIKETELRYRALEKEKIDIPENLLETLRYYKDM